MIQDYFRQQANASFPTRTFIARTLPVLLITIVLALILHYDLLIVSGLLFSYWVYQNFLPKRIILVERENNRLLWLVAAVAVISKLLFLFKMETVHHQSIHSSVLNPASLYQLCYLSVTYESFGFVKRGLIPSLVQLASKDYLIQLYLVQAIGFATFMAGLFALNRSKVFDLVQKSFFIPALLLSPVGIYYYSSFTFGFYDMTLIGLLFLSFSKKGHPASVIFDVAGLLVHEAYLLLRLPFLVLDLFQAIARSSDRKVFRDSWLPLLVNMAVFALVIGWPKPGAEALINNYLHQFQSLKGVTLQSDYDAFIPLSKEGTLMADFYIMKGYFASQKFLSFLIPLIVSLASINCFTYLTSRLRGTQRLADICCSMGSFCFPLLLGLVGADYGRWLTFSYITWLSYYLLFRPLLFPGSLVSKTCLYAVLLTAFLFIPFGYNFHPLFSRLFG